MEEFIKINETFNILNKLYRKIQEVKEFKL